VYDITEDVYVRNVMYYKSEDNEAYGIGGVRKITLDAVEAGKGNFEMAYARPWEFDGFEEGMRAINRTDFSKYYNIQLNVANSSNSTNATIEVSNTTASFL